MPWLKPALLGCVAAAIVSASATQAQQPVKIRASWVAPVANWASILLEKKELARHLGKSYVFEPVRFAGTPPMVTATVAGLNSVERELIWSARNMGASDRELMWQVLLPASLPQILTGLQVALPLCLIVAVVAEMAMGGYGLGGAMNTASRFADSRGVFAGIVEIAAVGYCLIKLMAILRRRLLLWHQEALEPTTA